MNANMYLVIAYRYGTNEYFFPVCISRSEIEAKDMAREHRQYRGGKYDHKLFVMKEGEGYDAEETKGVWITGEHADT